jgi:mannan endo-1,4-beta-mannosidase
MPSSSDFPRQPDGRRTPEPIELSEPAGPVDPGDGIHESNGVYESDDGIYDDDPDDTTGGGWRLSRLNMGLLCLSVASLSAALYISPAGSDVRDKVQGSLPDSAITRAITNPGSTGTPTPTGSPKAGPSAAARPATGGTTPLGSGSPARAGTTSGGSGTRSISGVSALSPLTTGGYQYTGSGGGRGSGGWGGSGGSGTHPTRPPSSHPTPTPSTAPTPGVAAEQLTKCYQFKWQQDAQKVYVQNLSDPYGLDADPGPNDGDGLACSELPVDPSRPASAPAAAYSPPKPSVAAKRSLLRPAKDYFGFQQDGVPGDTAAVEGLAARAGKAPSTTGWFQSFDTAYRGDLVRKSWERGALPVITWMPVDEGSGTSYSLTSIIAGTHDRYLRRYAGDVVREGLPVSLRFAHEMNGSWYGWSAGRADYNNSPAKYIEAWRHVWQIFDDVGATDEVIWLWSPSRVDNLNPSPTNGLTPLASDYPGDAYVDWIGASVYLRQASTGPSYAASFAKTVAALEAVTDKPIFFGETAAVQSDLGVDRTTLKVQWIENVLGQFAADDQVIGFLWFNNVAATVVNGVEVTNDWRFDANEATRNAFRRVVADPAFAEGVPLD